jgi:hypothetical protein
MVLCGSESVCFVAWIEFHKLTLYILVEWKEVEESRCMLRDSVCLVRYRWSHGLRFCLVSYMDGYNLNNMSDLHMGPSSLVLHQSHLGAMTDSSLSFVLASSSANAPAHAGITSPCNQSLFSIGIRACIQKQIGLRALPGGHRLERAHVHIF